MKYARVGIATVLMVVLVACSSMGLVQPQGYDQRLQYANGMLTGLMNGTSTSIENDQLGSEEGLKILDMAEKASTFIDEAEEAGDSDLGHAKLALAMSILRSLQTYTNQRTRK